MNALQLLFNPETCEDSLITGKQICIDDDAAAFLAQSHFINRIDVLECEVLEDDTTPASDLDIPESSTLYVQVAEGWLFAVPTWTEPVRLLQVSDSDDARMFVSIFEKRLTMVTRWLYDLHLVALEMPDPYELLLIGHRLIGLPFVLFDGGFNLIAHAMKNSQRSKAFMETVERGYAVGVTEEHQRQYRRLLSEHPDGFETIFQEDEGNTPVWVHPFSTCHGQPYYLHVMFGREHHRGMRSLIDALVDELRAALERMETTFEHTAVHDFVAELVTIQLSELQIKRRADFFGWNTANGYLVMRVEPFGRSFPDPQLNEVCAQLLHILPRAHATTMDHGITLLMGLENDSNIHVIPSSGAIETLLAQECMWMVVSDHIDKLSQASRAYDDICAALAIIWEDHEVGRLAFAHHIVDYDQCKLLLLTTSLEHTADKYDIFPTFLHDIEEYDTRHGTDFASTLFAFIKNMMNKADTCKRLNIHRSTLEYRLERLHDVFGVDLNDPMTVAHLQTIAILRHL